MCPEIAVFSRRAFSWGDDVKRIHALIVDSWTSSAPRNTFHIGDLHWRLRRQPECDPVRDIHLWEAKSGALAGFAWHEPPSSGDIFSRQTSYRTDLENEMLCWLESRRLQDRGEGPCALTTGALEGDHQRTRILRSRGYSRSSVGYPHHLIPLDGPLPNQDLPSGFRVLTMADGGDLGQRVRVHQSAWGSRNFTLETYRELSRGECYRPEFDIVAAAPEGRYAASCLAWVDSETSTALLEPVGCDPKYRRRGLTRAAILFCLGRLKGAGVREAVVNTSTTNQAAMRLYESCGFSRVDIDNDWVKRLS